ncbi:MAG: CapA family protein [Ignavibacteria bacterium]|nr:CapA family protein [Ignavibacteria bacterium]
MIKFLPVLIILLTLKTNSDSLSVLFLGDTHFGENYQYDPLYNHGKNFILNNGYDYFFYNVKSILLEMDAVYCNLETPLTKDIKIISSRKKYLHWSNPDSTVKYFNKYNIKYVSLGNNHVMDMSLDGLYNSIDVLNKAVIIKFGAGYDLNDALYPSMYIKDGFKIFTFGGFEYRPNYDTLYHYYAGNSTAGVNVLDTIKLNESILFYKKNYPDSYIIIYPHWGSNYGKVNKKQIAYAHSWINAGADAVIGHGAHTIQPIEKFNGKYIFYNIGNFIFNAPGRYASTGAKPYGLMVNLLINKTPEYKLYPIYTNNKKCNFQLRALNEAEKIDMLEEYFTEICYLISPDGSILLK